MEEELVVQDEQCRAQEEGRRQAGTGDREGRGMERGRGRRE